MADPEEMYQMLKRRDAEIAALRGVIESLIAEFASMYADDEQAKAYERASERLREIYDGHGFRSDGRLRG